jgi:hypothetical protein
MLSLNALPELAHIPVMILTTSDGFAHERHCRDAGAKRLFERIGITLDLKGGRMFLTDLGGSVCSANLDGSNKKTVLGAEGNLTGIAYAEIPAAQ